MALLDAEDVWKTYDQERWVLEDVSLSVPEGEFALVTGRSGSGKTTLFNVLGLLDQPTRGRVRVAGEDATALDEEARARLRLERIGFVFQAHNLIPDLTIRENVQVPLELSDRDDGQDRADELLAEFGIADLAENYPGQVSGGEAQRTAIARALANEPDVVLADEPTGNLDAANVDVVLDALRDVNERFGTTVLVVSHDPLVIDAIGTRWRLKEGKLSED